MKNKRLLHSLSFIDEEYVKEAEPKMTTATFASGKTLRRVACLVLAIALSLFLFIPFRSSVPDVTAYSQSEYFPIIERMAAYRYTPSPYKNNFGLITGKIGDFFSNFSFGMMKSDAEANISDGNTAPNGAMGSANGSYVETTDNQVGTVIEADLMKRTDKYVFRLGLGVLSVYTIDKDDTKRVAEFTIPLFDDEYYARDYQREMYLSEDGNTVTVIAPYHSTEYEYKVRLLSIDVSDLTSISIKKSITIDGSYKSSRLVDGRILLISEYYVPNNESLDYANPETYVPSINDGEKEECIRFEDIIYPDELDSMSYSVVSLVDADTLDLLGANALLDFNRDIYVSENNVYVTKEYSKQVVIGDEDYTVTNMCDIAMLSYNGGELSYKGTLTTEGHVKDQYSMDEYEGHFRVVTSTYSYSVIDSVREVIESASLAVFNLEAFEKIAEVKNFAPQGEEAASVRFNKDKAYVCTAVIVKFTDPVYFFDLSDYSNITYTDTGVIDGFSSSLIQLGDGYLLGMGQEDRSYGKVEIYEERDGAVVSVDKYLIDGSYANDYKAYYIDRETDTFGLGIAYIYDKNTGRSYNAYVLLTFNGSEIVERKLIRMKFDDPDRLRAFVEDGYLYITDDSWIAVEKIAD